MRKVFVSTIPIQPRAGGERSTSFYRTFTAKETASLPFVLPACAHPIHKSGGKTIPNQNLVFS
jgi:hypothetical protein